MNLPEAPKHHLFVSHVTEDRVAAMEIVEALERRGVKCWITPRDVRPGRFDDQISDAIDHCSALLLIFSDRCNESDYIYREVTVAGEARKPVLPLRIEDCVPRRGLRLRLMDIHWIDAFAARQEAIETIIRTVGVVEETGRQGAGDPDRASADLVSPMPGAPSAEEGAAGSEPEAGASPGAPRPPSDLAGAEAPGAVSGLLSSAATVAPPEALPASPEADGDGNPATSGHHAGNDDRREAMEDGRSFPAARPGTTPSPGRQFDLGFILAAPDGRSTRGEWWAGLVVLAAMAAILGLIIAWAYGSTPTALILTLALQLFLAFPSYALSAKRFRDRGKPGALALVGIVLGLLVALARMAGLTSPVPTTPLDWTPVAALLIVGVWYLIELGCLRGTAGPNAYGPDPLGGRPAAG